MTPKVLRLFNDIPGYLTAAEAGLLYDCACDTPQAGTMLELGSFKGKSSVVIGSTCVGVARRLHCVDTWDGNDLDCTRAEYRNAFDEWRGNVERAGLLSYVVPHQMTTEAFLQSWAHLGAVFDFVFIDACHVYEFVRRDFEMVLPLVRPGGRIAFHDVGNYAHPGPGRVWNEQASKVLTDHQAADMVRVGQKP